MALNIITNQPIHWKVTCDKFDCTYFFTQQEEESSDNTTTTIDVKALCVKSHSYCKSREFVQTKCMTENIQDRCNITLQVISKVSTIVVTLLFYYSIIVFSLWNCFPMLHQTTL
jgi:hypothetical protein